MFKGRIGRLAYFLGLVYLLVPVVLLLGLLLAVGGFSSGAHTGPAFSSAVTIVVLILDVVWLVFYLIAGFGLIIRRWHDLNQSGWLALLQLIPLVSLVCALVQLFAPGTKGSNNYGDAADPSLNFKTVLLGSKQATSPTGPVPSTVESPAMTPSAPAAAPAQPTPPPPVPPTPPAAPAPSEPSGSDQPPSQS